MGGIYMYDLIIASGNLAWLVILILVIAGIFLLVYLKRHNKQVDIKGINFGPVVTEISDVKVNRIAFLTQPRDVSGRPAVLCDIKLRIFDKHNKPIIGKKVFLELNSFSGTDYLRGILEKTSGNNGEVVFTNLKILRSGSYELVAKVDDLFEKSASFQITPPGMDTDFASKPFGSKLYIENFTRKVSLNKEQDEIKFNGDEI
jgi:hypothetical protein